MKNEFERQVFTINITEDFRSITLGDEMVNFYHASLCLSKKRNSRNITVQEVHFNEGAMGKMVPNVRNTETELNTSQTRKVFPYLSGDESHILTVWNHALNHAVAIKQTDGIRFGINYMTEKNSNNCRTGVKVLIETMGMTFCDEYSMHLAGTKSEGMPIGKKYDHTKIENKPLKQLWIENESLLEKLPSLKRGRVKDVGLENLQEISVG